MANRYKVSGDVESNPGPTYAVEKKAILGSFHQGDRFGDTADIQCACNSSYALCWSKVKKVFVWNGSDLHHILVEGDLLYKLLNTIDLLSDNELPRSVQLFDFSVPVTFWQLETKIATLAAVDALFRSVVGGSRGVS